MNPATLLHWAMCIFCGLAAGELLGLGKYALAVAAMIAPTVSYLSGWLNGKTDRTGA